MARASFCATFTTFDLRSTARLTTVRRGNSALATRGLSMPGNHHGFRLFFGIALFCLSTPVTFNLY